MSQSPPAITPPPTWRPKQTNVETPSERRKVKKLSLADRAMRLAAARSPALTVCAPKPKPKAAVNVAPKASGRALRTLSGGDVQRRGPPPIPPSSKGKRQRQHHQQQEAPPNPPANATEQGGSQRNESGTDVDSEDSSDSSDDELPTAANATTTPSGPSCWPELMVDIANADRAALRSHQRTPPAAKARLPDSGDDLQAALTASLAKIARCNTSERSDDSLNSDQSLTLSESKQRKRTTSQGGWSSSSSPAATPSPKITAVGRV